ncbi:hypothetical protein GCM10018962_63120 [Dactylosporangium matsuzakiense]|uniref:Uncharacterized protein n=1 Tax=Dactylosporangium matsuzakiense TaxID=53360 RepID=A0A9W6KII3_9ACTN|nr:hypothetical protein GCM10017581_026470 [Dactylosporangium matsuzakiense]
MRRLIRPRSRCSVIAVAGGAAAVCCGAADADTEADAGADTVEPAASRTAAATATVSDGALIRFMNDIPFGGGGKALARPAKLRFASISVNVLA